MRYNSFQSRSPPVNSTRIRANIVGKEQILIFENLSNRCYFLRKRRENKEKKP